MYSPSGKEFRKNTLRAGYILTTQKRRKYDDYSSKKR